MTLIKSISGIRGTIGGTPGNNLTPVDAVLFATAYAETIKEKKSEHKPKILLGRDARPSGEMVARAVQAALMGMGVDIVDLGLTTTPSMEMAVPGLQADGGIILTASHNPVEWNALKLLDEKGEFISADDGRKIIDKVAKQSFDYASVHELGVLENRPGGYIKEHVEAILRLPEVNTESIKKRGFKVVIDAVNSTGGIAVPELLRRLGVDYECLYCTSDGWFPHNPEPLEQNLQDIMQAVPRHRADMGIVVDPDADRLALIDENGRMFGEEYTLVAAADYILSKKPGPVVSNLSSSRALRDLADHYGQPYFTSAVGEVNVVKKMKEVKAVIGGEGNGGVIYPGLHYGRDALVGIALILSLLAETGLELSELKKRYPQYYMAKEKIRLEEGMDIDYLLKKIAGQHKEATINTEDGVKMDFKDYWIHLRKSNTEPIIRIYTEAESQEKADALAERTREELKQLI